MNKKRSFDIKPFIFDILKIINIFHDTFANHFKNLLGDEVVNQKNRITLNFVALFIKGLLIYFELQPAEFINRSLHRFTERHFDTFESNILRFGFRIQNFMVISFANPRIP